MHAVDVLGAGLGAHQDDLLALRGTVLRLVGGEGDAAGGSTGGGRQPTRDHFAFCLRVERRMQQLIERARLDALDRLLVR